MSANYPPIAKVRRGGLWVITSEEYESLARGEFELVAEAQPRPEEGQTVVIPISGIIGKHCPPWAMDYGWCDLDHIDHALTMAENDSSIENVILYFDSPGGTITGIPETAEKISALAENKEVVAFTDSECCSGALWLASMAPSFYCTESAEVGSVGVYLGLMDVTRMYEEMGVKINTVSAGKYASFAGSPMKELTTDERSRFQADVDRIYAMFKAAVQRNREVPEEYCEGQIFMGQSAVDTGMCNGGLVNDFDALLKLLL